MSSYRLNTPHLSSGGSAPMSPTSSEAGEFPVEQLTGSTSRLKKSKRLLNGFKRISSHPSLQRTGSFASSLRSRNKSASSFSFSSAGSPYSISYNRSDSFGSSCTAYSTAPTSAASSPSHGASSPHRRLWLKSSGAAGTQPYVSLPHRPRPRQIVNDFDGEKLQRDYLSHQLATPPKLKRREVLNHWAELPSELQIKVLSYLGPRDLVRCSAVSRTWHNLCFDGQIWSNLDVTGFYQDISADGLCKIIKAAGPFVRDLNLRGCVQLRDRWNSRALADACRNLEHFSLEGCRIDRTTIHTFLLQNERLVHINLSGLNGVTNSALKIIAQYCPRLQHLNISWCSNVDSRGIRRVVESCSSLQDLRAGEIRGWNDEGLMREIFRRNTLERLVLMNCVTLTDEALGVLLLGTPEERNIDVLTGQSLAPPRKLRHLDLTSCRRLTDDGISKLAHTVPALEGLQLAKCPELTDDSLIAVLPTVPRLTHLDLEEVSKLTNSTLTTLAAAPCAQVMKHLSISSCENLGDAGMIPVVRSCKKMRTLELDNTRISDLVLTEAASVVRDRNRTRIAKAQMGDKTKRLESSGEGTPSAPDRPRVGLRIDAYDCANVTWSGVREVLSRNAEILQQPPLPVPRLSSQSVHYDWPTTQPYVRDVIKLKCFYNWQPTVEQHTTRVMRCDFAAAGRLERKWAEWMMVNDEAGAGGGISGGRRRRRRVREAQLLHADEEQGGGGLGGVVGAGGGIAGVTGGGLLGGRRRRARSGPGGCTVM